MLGSKKQAPARINGFLLFGRHAKSERSKVLDWLKVSGAALICVQDIEQLE
jgi:hypothetical protein